MCTHKCSLTHIHTKTKFDIEYINCKTHNCSDKFHTFFVVVILSLLIDKKLI